MVLPRPSLLLLLLLRPTKAKLLLRLLKWGPRGLEGGGVGVEGSGGLRLELPSWHARVVLPCPVCLRVVRQQHHEPAMLQSFPYEGLQE